MGVVSTDKTEGLLAEQVTAPVLWARDVVKSFTRGGTTLEVLTGASLEVQPQEVVVIAGPSGSGKSTLLAILGGLLTPDAGSVCVDGELTYDLDQAGRARLRANKIGYIFQRCHLIQGLTAAENVMMVAALQGQSPKDAQRLSLELLESVGMADHANATSAQMSLGQCQRVAVARSLAADPKLLLADEPTASLDYKNGQEVVALIREVGKQEGRGAVMVTHDHRIFSYADRVLWVENGKIKEVSHQQAMS